MPLTSDRIVGTLQNHVSPILLISEYFICRFRDFSKFIRKFQKCKSFSLSGENKNLKVHQIFHERGNMGKVLPEFLSIWTMERVREEGINVIPNNQVQNIDLFNNQLRLKLLDGTQVLCDHAIVAVGAEPNVQLAKESGLEIDSRLGGYLVNAELEARRHLYVVGSTSNNIFKYV